MNGTWTAPPTEGPTAAPTPTPTMGPTSAPGTGDGLAGEHCSGTSFGSLLLTRVDPVLDMSWGGGSPDPAVPQDQFSVRWTGKLEATMTETCTIYSLTDDGARVWINNQAVIDDWRDHAATSEYEAKGTIAMNMGQQYDIKVEYDESSGDASVRLSWENPFLAKQVIPKSQLFSGSSASTPAPTIAPTQQPQNLGDVNSNGSVDIVDALLVAQYYVGLNPSGFVLGNADTNCNGSVDIVDALLIAQYYVGLISRFC
jgi:hypothetical protein